MLLTIYKLKNHYLQIEKSKQQEIFRCIENNCFLGSERSFSIRLQHWKYDLGDSTTRFSPHGNGSLDPRKNHDMILWKQKIHRHLRILMASRVNYEGQTAGLYALFNWKVHNTHRRNILSNKALIKSSSIPLGRVIISAGNRRNSLFTF